MIPNLAVLDDTMKRARSFTDTRGINRLVPSQTSAVRDHDLAKMATALEMPVRRLGLGEGECPVDHGIQAVHGDRAVHCLEISATADADRAEGDAAAGQQ